jgi:hypothetical protein
MPHNIFFILEQNAVNQEKKLLQANECRFTRGNFFLQITNLYFISSNFIRLKAVRDNNFHLRLASLMMNLSFCRGQSVNGRFI